MDWYEVKFLESPVNLKGFIKESIGRDPSTNIATEISTCLQQGRLFFEAAKNAPLEIKPLQLFYGVVGFSKALTSARKIISTSALSQAHGLKDRSESNARLKALKVAIGSKGTFQHFNDSICDLESVNYFGKENETLKIYRNTRKSNLLVGKVLSLKTILSKIPSLSEMYKKTFNEESDCLPLSFYNHDSGLVELRIDLASYFQDRESLKVMVDELRTKYPFLKKWLLSNAQRCWDSSILTFVNVEYQGVNEFSESHLSEIDGRFERNVGSLEIIDFEKLLPPLAGGVINTHPTYIKPVEGIDISEYSIIYLGSFLMSSIVRYRPQIWVHSIKGRITQQRSSDDHCLAIIEIFLDQTLRDFPGFVINGMRVKLNQANSADAKSRAAD